MENEKDEKKREKMKNEKEKRKMKNGKEKKKKWKKEKKKRKDKKIQIEMKPCKILMTTLSLAVDWQAIFYSLSLFSNGDWTPLQRSSPPWKQVIPKSSTPFTEVYLREHFVMWTWVFLSENTEFNEISFISKKHRIIFVRKSVTDRSNRQCLRKIIKFDELAKSFECSHIRSLIIEAIHDARFVHKLPILPYRPWKIAKHSSIQQDCAVSKRKKSPSTKPIDQLIRTNSGQSPTSSLFRMHFLTRIAHRFVFAFHFFVFPFFMTTLLQLDVFSPKWQTN